MTVELLQGVLFGWLSGCVVALLTALVLAVSFVHLFVGWDMCWPTFRNLKVLLLVMIGVFVVPISVVLGLVHGRSGWLRGLRGWPPRLQAKEKAWWASSLVTSRCPHHMKYRVF